MTRNGVLMPYKLFSLAYLTQLYFHCWFRSGLKLGIKKGKGPLKALRVCGR